MINRSKKAKKLLVSKKKLALNVRLGNDSLRTITLRKAFRRDFSKHWNDSQESNISILANAAPNEEALELSREAYHLSSTAISAGVGGGLSGNGASRAYNAAYHARREADNGAHQEAATFHLSAASHHDRAAQAYTDTGRLDIAERHREAASTHRIAHDAHLDLTTNSQWETPQEASYAARGASQTAFDATEKAAQSHSQYSWVAANEANEYAKMAHEHSADPSMHGEALQRHERALEYHQAASKDHDDIAQSHSSRSHLHADARDAHLEAAQVHRDAISEYRDRGVTTNYNPDEPRDKLGKWTKLSSATHATLKSLRSLHHGVEHLEERTKSKVSHLMTKGVTKLPSHIQGLVHGISKALRGGTKLLFANWSMVQRFSDRVAQARGLTPEQSAKIHGVLSSIDLKTFEVFKVGSLLGAHSFHIPAIVTGTLPIATTGYLAWNTVKTGGLAPARAALNIVKDMKDKVIPAQRLAPHTIASGNLPGKMSYNEILSDSIFSNYNTTINSTAKEDAIALSKQASHETFQALIATSVDDRSPHAIDADQASGWANHDASNGDHRMAIHGHSEAIEHHENAIAATNSQEAKLAHTKAIDAHRIAIDAHKDADPTINAGQDAANAIVNAMESHHWNDWYDAILVASLDEVRNLYDAIGLANRAYTAHPKYEGEAKEDDAEVVLGKWVKDESILANSTSREDATALSEQAYQDSIAAQRVTPQELLHHAGNAVWMSHQAFSHAEDNDSFNAVHYHNTAIEHHTRALQGNTWEASRQAHQRAINTHRIAIDAHKDADTTINALTPAKEQALAVSRKADEDTVNTIMDRRLHPEEIPEHREAAVDSGRYSFRARNYAEQGSSEQAAHMHLLAARRHEAAANTTEHEPSIQAHRNAATSHYIARDAHLDAVNNRSADPDTYPKSNPNVIFSKYLTQAFALGLGHTYDASKLITPNHQDTKYHSVAKSEWLNDITQHPDTKSKLSGIISEGNKKLAGLDNMEDALRVGDTEILRSYGLGKELAKSRLLTVGGEKTLQEVGHKTKVTRSGKVRNISNGIVANASINQEALQLSEQAHKESQEIVQRTTANPQEGVRSVNDALSAAAMARDYARGGNSNSAGLLHRLAAIRHESAAKSAINTELHRANLSVAGLHRIAADAHTDADTTHNIAKGGQSIGNPNSQPLYYWQMKPDDMALLKNFSAVTNSLEVVKNMHDEETREASRGALAATQTAVKASRKLRMTDRAIKDPHEHASNAELASRRSEGSRDALKAHEHAVLAHEFASNNHIGSIHDARKNKDAHREASNLHLEAAKMHREAVAHYSDSGVGSWTNEARQASENANHASQTAIQRSHNSGFLANEVIAPVERANSLRGYGAGVIASQAHEAAARAHQYQARSHNIVAGNRSPDEANNHRIAEGYHLQAAHAHTKAIEAIRDSMNRPLDS